MAKGLLTLAIVAATILFAGWNHGSAAAEYEGKDWRKALEQVPCDHIKKNGNGSWTVKGDVTAGGNREHNPRIADGGRISIIEKHCPK